MQVEIKAQDSLLEEMDGLYKTSDGIPQASFGSAWDRKHFHIGYMGCVDDTLIVSKIGADGAKVATLISNYQGLLELRELVNSAYEALHSHVSQ
jgi:hypothetical protein